eukprot:3210540-Ditylum_brightwellii.AAC.1
MQQEKKLLLIGVMGAGKSTVGNTFLGHKAFEVRKDLNSCIAEFSHKGGVLFGDLNINTNVIISDTGGLDNIAAHVKALDGVQGIIFFHNACNQKLEMQTCSAVIVMVNTLTNKNNKDQIGQR